METKSEKLIRNMECVSCEKVFSCKGKPEHIITGCVNYVESKRHKESTKGEKKDNG